MAFQHDVPTGENLVYGDATVTSAARHLSDKQFPVKMRTPSVDAGWLGPIGSYGEPSASGSLYGFYGIPTKNPQPGGPL